MTPENEKNDVLAGYHERIVLARQISPLFDVLSAKGLAHAEFLNLMKSTDWNTLTVEEQRKVQMFAFKGRDLFYDPRVEEAATNFENPEGARN